MATESALSVFDYGLNEAGRAMIKNSACPYKSINLPYHRLAPFFPFKGLRGSLEYYMRDGIVLREAIFDWGLTEEGAIVVFKCLIMDCTGSLIQRTRWTDEELRLIVADT